MEKVKKISVEVETLGEHTHLDDSVSASGGCEAALTARFEWVASRECGDMLYDRRFPLKLNVTIYKSYVRSAILL